MTATPITVRFTADSQPTTLFTGEEGIEAIFTDTDNTAIRVTFRVSHKKSKYIGYMGTGSLGDRMSNIVL